MAKSLLNTARTALKVAQENIEVLQDLLEMEWPCGMEKEMEVPTVIYLPYDADPAQSPGKLEEISHRVPFVYEMNDSINYRGQMFICGNQEVKSMYIGATRAMCRMHERKQFFYFNQTMRELNGGFVTVHLMDDTTANLIIPWLPVE